MTEDQDLDLVDQLADEFADRLRAGERPSIKEYADRHPKLAEIIRDTFEALAMMENMAPGSDDSFGAEGNEAATAGLKQLGDFRIIREVGRGGMGVVYEAEQVSLGRHVALKVLPSAALPDDKHIRRFEREAKSAAKLHHTNIVPVFGVGAENGLHYYVMQFIQGLPLDEVIDELKKIRAQPTGAITATASVAGSGVARRSEYSVADVARSLMTGQFAQTEMGDVDSDAHSALALTMTEVNPQADSSETRRSETFNLSGSFSGSAVRLGKSGVQSSQRKPYTYWQSVAHIGSQVADAMQYAHDQGILHRDIKPSNLLLDLRGTTWVTDFGLAKATDQQDITHTGDILGTLRYMPPEAFEGRADARSDVYSLGLTLYELLSFQPAFGVKDRHQLIKQVTTEPAPRLDRLNPEIPRDLVTIIHKAVDRDPAHRYQTAQELEDDLQRFIEDEPIKARRTSTIERFARWSRRNRGLAASLAAVCALLLVINIAGPLMYVQMSRLYDNLVVEQGKLTLSESELRDTVSALQEREQELEETGRHLQDETDRANQEAADKAAETQAAIAAREEAERQKELTRKALYSSSMLTAERLLETPGRAGQLSTLLGGLRPNAGETDLRGWEWFYASSQIRESRLTLRVHENHIHDIEYSPDGTLVASVGHENTLQIWNADTGAILHTLSEGPDVVWWNVDWTPDGRHVMALADTFLCVWDAVTGDFVQTLPGEPNFDNGHALAVAPSGDRVAVVSENLEIRIWDLSSGDVVTTLPSLNAVQALDWSPDGNQLVVVGAGPIRIWNAVSGEPANTLSGPESRKASVVWAEDQMIATVESEEASHYLRTWDLGTETLGNSIKSQIGPLRDIAWSPEQRLLVACSDEGKIQIWNPDSDPEAPAEPVIHDLRGTDLQCLAFRPGGAELASGGRRSDAIQVWDLDPDSAESIQGYAATVVQYSPDGGRLAAADPDDMVRIWETRTRRQVAVLQRGSAGSAQGTSLALDWHPDGDRLAAADSRGNVLIWDVDTGDQRHVLRGHGDDAVYALRWSPNGDALATAGADKRVQIWDALTGESVSLTTHPVAVVSLDWSPDGEQFLSADVNGVLRLFSSPTDDSGERFGQLDTGLTTVRFSPDGMQFVTAGRERLQRSEFADLSLEVVPVIRLWDTAARSEIRSFRGHTSTVKSLDWSRDGKRILSSSTDGTVRLWDVDSGQELLLLDSEKHESFTSAQFSPGGLQVAAAGDGASIEIWDTFLGHARDLSPRLLPLLNTRIAAQPTPDDLVLRGRVLALQGRWDEAADDFRRASADSASERSEWFLSPWWVVGPYAADLTAAAPPERSIDPLLSIPPANPALDDTEQQWLPVVAETEESVNLGQLLHQVENASGYAQLRVFCPVEKLVGVLFGADDALRLWFNGQLVHSRSESRTAARDDEAVEVRLQPGWNTLLAKVSNNTSDHGLFLRLSDDPAAVASVFERNEQWPAALAWWERAQEEQPGSPDILLGLGRAALYGGQADLATRSFQALLADDQAVNVRSVAAAYANHAKSLIDASRANEAGDSLERARTLYQELLSGEEAEDRDAADLADVLLARDVDEVEWTVLQPVEMTSEGGATLSRLEDRSILASGVNPASESYTIVGETELTRISAVRLEALTHDSLPMKGPGRQITGIFAMTSIALSLSGRSSPEDQQPLPFAFATADYALDSQLIRPTGGWNIAYGGGRAHTAVFASDTPPENPDGFRLSFTMDFKPGEQWPQFTLGRFRISVADDPAAFESNRRRFAMANITDPLAQTRRRVFPGGRLGGSDPVVCHGA